MAYDDYSAIFTGFLLALLAIPLVAVLSRNSLRSAPANRAVVNGLVIVALLLQYVHLVYVATYAPHHSTWSTDNTYVRFDCFESEKGGKLAHDFRDCLLGQGDACTPEEPCTPCPPGGNASSTNVDFHRYVGNYTRFLCRNCTDPYRSKFNCQYAPQYGPYCLVDENAAGPPSSARRCASASGLTELAPMTDVPHLPFFMLRELGYVSENSDGVETVGTFNTTAKEFSYSFPTHSDHACERCCTKMWDEDDWIPAAPVINPPGGDFTRLVSVEVSGAGVFYTLDGTDPDPCTSNGLLYFEDPVEIAETGTTVMRAISTYRGMFSREIVEAVFEIVDCSDEWFLEMSSPYPSGGLANDKAALLDDYPQQTGAGTGNEYKLSHAENWLAMRFSAIVFLDQVTLSVYDRDRWGREQIVGATLEYFNTTRSDVEDTPFEVAVSDKHLADQWFFLATIDDTIPDEGTFTVPIPDNIGIKYLRIRSDSWLAVGTMIPNVTGCFNSTNATTE